MTCPPEPNEGYSGIKDIKHRAQCGRPDYRWSALLLIVVACWWGLLASKPNTGEWLGLGLRDGWFTDLHAVLAAGEAHVQGIPIHRTNPLDMFGRPHSYPSCWLLLGEWGLTRADTPWLGALLLTGFLTAATVVRPPRHAREFAWRALVLLAPCLQLGMVRANNDLVIFLVLAPLTWCLTHPSSLPRIAAVGLISLAAALKYYPAIGGILLLSEQNRRLFWSRLISLGVLFAMVGWIIYDDTRHFATTLPKPSGIFAFGVSDGLALLGQPRAFALGFLMSLMFIGLAGQFRRRGGRSDLAPDRDELDFILAAALLAGCFWTTMNWGYRWIFALWLLPVLLREHRSTFVLNRWEQRALLVLLPICLWADGLACLWWNIGGGHMPALSASRFTDLCWRGLQPAHWTVFSLLTLACVRFAAREAQRFLPGKDPTSSST